MQFPFELPFELLDICWPQPVDHTTESWTSAPAWDAPRMPAMPAFKLRIIEDLVAWSIDWVDFFRTGLRTFRAFEAGEMRGFHIVFRLAIYQTGTLVFWDDDGSIIRRNGEVVHEDRAAHALTEHHLQVEAGDILEVAQWQLGWGWLWCAIVRVSGQPDLTPEAEFMRILPAVRQQLKEPTGPALKVYTAGWHPLRLAAAIYSMILNGYTPSAVYLYGEEQWPDHTRQSVVRLLPFAQVVTQSELMAHVHAMGGSGLVELARRHWFAAKAFVALAAPPFEACMMDDDLFILAPVTDALEAFRRCDLVYAPDQDLSHGFLRHWQHLLPCRGELSTGHFNAGLYWIRNIPPARTIASAALRCPASAPIAFLWEQGLIAMLYAARPTCRLNRHQYAFPVFDGLPGGMDGYEYQNNPCGYTSIHFGGLAEKPSDALAVQLIGQIASRRTNTSDRGLEIAVD